MAIEFVQMAQVTAGQVKGDGSLLALLIPLIISLGPVSIIVAAIIINRSKKKTET